MHLTLQQFRSILGRSRSTVRTLLLPWSIIVLVVALGPSVAWSAESEIVARVNGDPVTRGELQRMLADPRAQHQVRQELGGKDPGKKELDRQVLQKLIKQRLLLQEASRRNLKITDQELDQAITTLRRSFKDLREFGVWMNERGFNDQSLFESVRSEMLAVRARAALVEGVRLSEAQVQEYYEANKNELKIAGDVRLRIIVVKDKAAGEDILAALRKGEDFATLARQRSMGKRAAKGGDTGWVNPQTLSPPLRKAVGTLKVGEIGGPLQKDDEILIVGLVGRRAARTKSLAEARPDIERRLLAVKQQETVQAWLTEQENKAKIEMFP